MNKKELIDYCNALKENKNKFINCIDVNRIINTIKQLEPEKVKVSEEEAKFLETFDFDRDSDITKALYYVSRAGWGHQITDNNNVEMKDLTEDVVFFVKNRKRLIKAILFGYEVEKEKRYRVKFIQTGQHLAKNIFPKSEYFVIKTSAISSTDSFTRKELEEAGFGWVFDCEGIEIEEVTE